MNKLTHPELIERLKQLDTIDLLYCYIEAKTGQHVDLIGKLQPQEIEAAIEAINGLVIECKTLIN